MASMSVTVAGPLFDWIQSRVNAGHYASASDYLRELIQRDQQAVREQEGFPPTLKASVERGVADSVAGRVYDAADVFDRLEAKYEAMAAVAEG